MFTSAKRGIHTGFTPGRYVVGAVGSNSKTLQVGVPWGGRSNTPCQSDAASGRSAASFRYLPRLDVRVRPGTVPFSAERELIFAPTGAGRPE